MTAHGGRPWRVALSETTLGAEEIAAVTEVLSRGWLSAGPVTRQFEREFAGTVGTPYAVAVSSGTAALHLALLALGIGPGDEVILPALSFVAAAAMTVAAGAVPVFADVCSADDLTIDPADVARRITPRTKAVVAMHYAGYSADLGRLGRLAAVNGLALVEDAAHAPAVASGSGQPGTGMLGTIGDVGCFSFHPAKNMTTGEGGMIVSADVGILTRCRAMRSHHMTQRAERSERGERAPYDIDGLGFNYRPTEISSAIGRVQLGKLGSDRRIRSALVARYRDGLSATPGLLVPFTARQGSASAHHLFAIVLPAEVDRGEFRAALHAAGVQTSVHYPPTHLMSYYRRRRQVGDRLPVCEDVAGRLVSLPLHALMSEVDVDYVAAEVAVALLRARR